MIKLADADDDWLLLPDINETDKMAYLWCYNVARNATSSSILLTRPFDG